MSSNIVLRAVAKFFIPFLMLFALYVQFHGDYGPGGGFQAGVIFAAGFILHALIYGLEETQKVAKPSTVEIYVALGVLLYAGTGVVSLLKGGTFLNYSVLEHNPVHGQHLGILLVELGVGITVASVMITIFYGFAGRGRS